uniref:50S ribosomal protein L21, chloroplastic n=1 Tax=Apoglossum ruscifolium TaxID=167976 RepID=A0A4D6WLY7_9FLOR|nr:ribosomal protein L21 [Apoglossum ruscifolium]
MNYAIVDVSGRQVWMEPGKFYDINYIPGNPGDLINLNRVLLVCKNDLVEIGKPCLSSRFVKTKIVKHVNSQKLTIFKIKPKKNARCKKGHRQKLTRLLVEDIF